MHGRVNESGLYIGAVKSDEHWWVVGSGDGAGKLPVPGHPTTLAYSRAGACCAAGAGWWTVFLFFHLVYPTFLVMPHLFLRRLDMTEIMWSRPL